MNRGFSPFTNAKAKIRRQKFALTKKTMDESSDEDKSSTSASASAQASTSTSYTAYDPPSPTIGGLVGVGNFIQGISPLALFNKTGSEPEPEKVKAKAGKGKDNDPKLFWKLDEEPATEVRAFFFIYNKWRKFYRDLNFWAACCVIMGLEL